MTTDQDTIERPDPQEDTNFLNSLMSIGKVMAVDLTSEGCGGRKRDRDLTSNPSLIFVPGRLNPRASLIIMKSSTSHNRLDCGLDPEQLTLGLAACRNSVPSTQELSASEPVNARAVAG